MNDRLPTISLQKNPWLSGVVFKKPLLSWRGLVGSWFYFRATQDFFRGGAEWGMWRKDEGE